MSRGFLLHGGCPDTSDRIDAFLKHLLELGAERTRRRLSLTLYPAAKSNDPRLRQRIRDKIGRLSGGTCVIQELLLGKVPDGEPTAVLDIERVCTAADIVLMMNGDTRHAARLAYEHGVTSLLERASRKGTILAGWSCGAIIHGMASVSDSNAFMVDESAGESWEWLTISKDQGTTLGSLGAIICAHEGQVRELARPTPDRSAMHRRLIAEQGPRLPAFLLPENMALLVRDERALAIDYLPSNNRIQVACRTDNGFEVIQELHNRDA